MAINRDDVRGELATPERLAGYEAAATNRMLVIAMSPRRVAPRARNPVAQRVFLSLVLALAGAVGVVAYAAATRGDENLRTICRDSLALESFLAMVAVAGALLSRRPLIARLGLGPSRLQGNRIAVLVLGTLALSFALDGLLEAMRWSDGTPLAEFESRIAGARGADLLLALLAIGIAPGIGEELLCRGLVQRGLEPVIGRVWAVVLGATLFGALHIDPVYALFAGALGLYLGAVALVAGSVRTAILCHITNNLVAVGIGAGWPEIPAPGAAGIGLGVAVAGVCLWGARRTREPTLQVRPGSDDR